MSKPQPRPKTTPIDQAESATEPEEPVDPYGDDDEAPWDDEPVPERTAEQLAAYEQFLRNKGPELPKGTPRHYTWWSPNKDVNAVLVIEYSSYRSAGGRWQLSMDGAVVKHYAHFADAMHAVAYFETGDSGWDGLRGKITPPSDERDWIPG